MDKDAGKLNKTDYKRFEDSLYYALKSIEQEAFVYCYSDVPEYVQAHAQLKECISQIRKREVK